MTARELWDLIQARGGRLTLPSVHLVIEPPEILTDEESRAARACQTDLLALLCQSERMGDPGTFDFELAQFVMATRSAFTNVGHEPAAFFNSQLVDQRALFIAAAGPRYAAAIEWAEADQHQTATGKCGYCGQDRHVEVAECDPERQAYFRRPFS